MRNKRGQFLAYPILQCSSSLLGTAPCFVHITEMGSLTPLASQPADFRLIREDNRFQFFHEEREKGDAKRNKNNK